jgi:membrane associated rhomboid family serine protease
MNVTILLIATIVIMQGLADSKPELLQKLMFSSERIRNHKEYHRLISPFLVHSGWVHVLMNGIALYYFTPIVEYAFGVAPTFLFFLFSVLGGSLLSLRARRKDADYLAVGASGGVSGLVMISIFLAPDMGIGLFLIPVFIPAYLFGILFSLASIGLTFLPNNHISHEGHLGGLFIGRNHCHCRYGYTTTNLRTKFIGLLGVLPIAAFAVK